MKEYKFLSWLLCLYKDTIKNQDKLILIGHYCLIQYGFVIDNEDEETNELLTIIKVEYLFEDDMYFMLFTINNKESEFKVPIKDHFIDGVLLNVGDLIENIEKRTTSILKYRRTQARNK
ncbi:unnamed protein product [Rotaria sp. Silwood2]|nr:unnamed protein product [Rotaria sp. Silwood2]CAF4446698.1 unnamed protein product [Rotaria sp. Silwood2]